MLELKNIVKRYDQNPPVMLPAKEFIRKEIFEMGKVFAIVVYTMGYCLVLSSLKIAIMNRNRFE